MEDHICLISKAYEKARSVISSALVRRYENSLRKKLKNDNFSIICSNCIGGIIYNRLGKKFLSPTINMWMKQTEFLDFLENIESFITKDIVPIESPYSYPVGCIEANGKRVTLYFNHSHTFQEACNDWYRRRTRINFDNLYIMMYDRDGITRDDILRLERIPCCNKVVFSEHSYPDIPYVLTIKGNDCPYGVQYLDKDWLGIRTFEKYFDFVEFLNQ